MAKDVIENRGTGIIAAEKYAQFFLNNPHIAAVYVFGSVALRGDGHDVDMILETKDPKLGWEFLKKLNREVRRMMGEAYQNNTPTSDDYSHLHFFRMDLAYSLLGITQEDQSGELRDIYFSGRFKEWDDLCITNKWPAAQKLEDESFRETDLFLMPPGWRESDKVKDLLPNWVSERPWTKRSFYRILVLQSRLFNSGNGHFNPRRKGSESEESAISQALEQELREGKYHGKSKGN